MLVFICCLMLIDANALDCGRCLGISIISHVFVMWTVLVLSKALLVPLSASTVHLANMRSQGHQPVAIVRRGRLPLNIPRSSNAFCAGQSDESK